METIGLIAGTSGCALSSELHKRGIRVALVMGKEKEPGYDIADAVLVADFSQHDNIISFFRENGVRNVIAGTGPAVAIRLLSRLERDGFSVNIDIEKFHLCKDKFALKELLKKQGITVPKDWLITQTHPLDDVLSEIDYPCVLKSIQDYQPPEKISDADRLRERVTALLENEANVLIEEYICGNDLTVFVADTPTGQFIKPIYWSKGAEDRLTGFEDSFSEPLNAEQEEYLRAYAERIAGIMKIPGVYRIDLIMRDGAFYFLEINTIIVSSFVTSSYAIKFFQSGINRARMIVDCALQKFGISCDRRDCILLIASDETSVSGIPENVDFIRLSPDKVHMLYYNKLDTYGIDLFCSWLKQNGIEVVDKDMAKDVLTCLLTSDSESVQLYDYGSQTYKIDLLEKGCQFLNRPYRRTKV